LACRSFTARHRGAHVPALAMRTRRVRR
jgi:hypothetical protein